MWRNIPNLLSLARIAAIPVIVILIWPGIESAHTCFWATVIYAIAGITDLIDGAIARRTNQVTILGKFLDPLSDKLFYLVTMVALLQLPGPRVPPWLVMIVLVRELTITGLRAIAMSEGIVIDAKEGGKIKTTFATIGMCGLLLHYEYVINFGPIQEQVSFHLIGLWITFLSVVFSLTSGFGYIRGFVRGVQSNTKST
ncbi:MAG: CDP-diacylglycerol--glycerol-3-phosphate 3-phosphatidyltransferase [Deltaproteobacteria bacterium RIFOXYA12_FULL_58_15]|nr:MAG: CDP-diacylglycerol--glycerol-3-phosphate 3-phosphatidyltransferase [Deltaproteobacteria bacterium RIFOXYA12_FULL_58_15]OGR11651.1 MAG: CDP-diacylglycerol--glycerol-3-phosphate 3-phosphatidyltransferase [Deltaproteobacteria bacterium RIFOXYB12_FULL_58_9]